MESRHHYHTNYRKEIERYRKEIRNNDFTLDFDGSLRCDDYIGIVVDNGAKLSHTHREISDGELVYFYFKNYGVRNGLNRHVPEIDLFTLKYDMTNWKLAYLCFIPSNMFFKIVKEYTPEGYREHVELTGEKTSNFDWFE